MKQEAAAIEHNGSDAGLLGGFGERQTNLGRSLGCRAGTLAALDQRRCRGDRAAGKVVDDLGIDMPARTVNRKTRTSAGASPEGGANAATAAFEKR